MDPLSASELLSVWERGPALPTARRALLLLGAACPETPPEALERLSIGRRDALLLALRAQTFGDEMDATATCPACSERLEMSFSTRAVLAGPVAPSDEAPDAAELTVEAAGYRARFRLPDSRDFLALPEADDATLERFLLERCLLEVRREGSAVAKDELPDHVAAAVVERMAAADPQADVWLKLCCGACGHHWQTGFDVVSFFWNEIDAWARRLLPEVGSLAHAFGWREADILAMSPWRRQAYLEMVSS